MGLLQVILRIADPTGTGARILGQITDAARKNKALLIIFIILLIPLALIFGTLVPVFSIPAIISGIITLIIIVRRKPEWLKWYWNNEISKAWRLFFIGSVPISLGGALFVYTLWVIVILQEVFIST